MLDKSKAMVQTKRNTLILQVGGFDARLTTPPHKKIKTKLL
jgi:hypothetical protein